MPVVGNLYPDSPNPIPPLKLSHYSQASPLPLAPRQTYPPPFVYGYVHMPKSLARGHVAGNGSAREPTLTVTFRRDRRRRVWMYVMYTNIERVVGGAASLRARRCFHECSGRIV